MKPSLLLGLLLILALACALGGWFFTGRPAAPAQAGALTPPAADVPQAPATELLETDPRTVEARAHVPEAPAFDLDSARWVRGEVRFPEGCARDPELAAYAFARATDYAAAVRRLEAEDREELLVSAAVQADGGFELPFPGDATTGWVLLRGRWLYTPRTQRVDLTTNEPYVVLGPRAGCCLVGTVELPVDRDDPGSVELSLSTELGNLNLGNRSAAATRLDLDPALDEDGTFVVRAVPAESDYALSAGHPTLAAALVLIDGLRPGRDHAVSIALEGGGALAGRVIDEDGRPVTGATATAFRPGSMFGLDDRGIREAEVDAEGRFLLVGVAPGAVKLGASATGYLEAKRLSVTVTDGETDGGHELVVTRGGTIAGTVDTPEGRPAAGAEVRVTFDIAALGTPAAFNALRGAQGEAMADEDGRFRVSGLGLGPFSVRARAEVEGESWRARADGVTPGSEHLALRLAPPAGLRGRVIDLEGTPVTAFRIAARRASNSPLGGIEAERRSEHQQDPDGRFMLAGLDPGAWDVWVEGPRHVTLEVITATAPTPAGEELELTAVLAARVRGVVRSPEGSPVPGARVTFTSAGAGSLLAEYDAGPPMPEAFTDQAGGFDLPMVIPIEGTLSAEAEQWARSTALALVPQPGETIERVELVLTLGGTLTGEVFDEAGQRAPGRMVTVMGMQSLVSGSLASHLARTDADGEFRFEHLDPGSWQVVAIDQRQSWTGDDGGMDMGAVLSSLDMAQAEIVEGETTHVVIGAPPADPVRVHGTVTLGGEPFGGANLSFYPEGEQVLAGLELAPVDGAGGYAVVLDGPGTYLVNVQRLGAGAGQQSTIEYSVEIPSTREHRLDFALPLGRISGRVLGPQGPARGVRVSITRDDGLRSDSLFGGAYHEVASDEQGRFDVLPLRPGTYRVSAGGALPFGLGGGELGRVTRGDVVLAQDEWIDDLELRLPRAGALDVLARGPGGAPVEGATVFVRDAGGRPLEPLSMTATDATGRCAYEGLAPGDYTVLARDGSLASVEVGPLRVGEGERSAVELELEPGTVLWIQLKERGGEGAPLHASLRVLDEHGRDVSGLLGFSDLQHLYGTSGFSTSEHRLGPLAPGRYMVHAEAGELRASKPVRLDGGGERKLVLRLR